jgi:hypothetical protein
MPTFQSYDPGTQSALTAVNALLAANPGIVVDAASIRLRYGKAFANDDSSGSLRSSVSLYDGSIPGLSIGPGLLLTSGDGTPPSTNQSNEYSSGFVQYIGGSGGDADLQAVANSAFELAGQVEDVSSLSFSFTVTDPNVKGIRFDVVFGSDEYPEFADSDFVDVGAFIVNGANYALFNAAADQPLSVVSQNLINGNFRDNQAGGIPIEYDGVSRVLTVVAPVRQGVNTIKIGVGDTGDPIYDSGLFISNLKGVNYTGFGLAPVQIQPAAGLAAADTAGNQLYSFNTGSSSQVNFSDAVGNDVVDAVNAFVTASFTIPTSQVLGYSFSNNVLELITPSGTKQLVDVERVDLADSYYAFDTQVGEDTWQAFALLKAGFDTVPTQALLSQWVRQADASANMGDLAQSMLDFYAPGISASALVSYLYGTLAGISPTQAQVQEFASLVGPGKTFAKLGDLFAFAASLDINTNTFVEFVGSIQSLDPSLF